MAGARDIARKVLLRVEREQAFAAAALAAETARLKDERDVGLAYELVLGSLRRERWLDHLIGRVSDKGIKKIDPEVMIILRIAAYQIAFLSRIPAAAAVNDAVSACRRTRAARLSGLVNALLRKLTTLPEALLLPPSDDDGADLSTLGTRFGLPDFLVEEFIDRFGRKGAFEMMRSFNEPSRRTLRINAHRISRDEAALRIKGRASSGTLSLWALDVDASQGAELLVEEGLAAHQDEAAQLAVVALEPRPGEKILDVCAGRGGKSAAILAATDGKAMLHAVDVSSSKLDRLSFELSKQGLYATTEVCDLVASSPAAAAGPFDKILVDAPCSGSGTLGRRPEIRRRLTPSSVRELAALQTAILDHAATALKKGGRLVFVVCSLLDAEGFGHCERFLAQHPGFTFAQHPPNLWPEQLPWNGGRILIDPSLCRTDGYQFLVFEKQNG